jgi:deazaflavin-dependent oxidoreductase (nitroreductase family)
MKLFNAVTGANVVLYRLSGGRLGSGPVLLLEHTDRKSGPRRTTPVLYIQDGDDLVVVGSRVGSDFDPAWWLNLKANPATTVQVRSQRPGRCAPGDARGRRSGCGRASSTPTPSTRFTSGERSARSR